LQTTPTSEASLVKDASCVISVYVNSGCNGYGSKEDSVLSIYLGVDGL